MSRLAQFRNLWPARMIPMDTFFLKDIATFKKFFKNTIAAYPLDVALEIYFSVNYP